jgi:DNA-binding transcriptional ArsR family regulator
MKFIDIEKSDYRSHPSRPAILRILREGIIDEINKIQKHQIARHVLNTAEIQNLLSKKENIKISRTNLYFHLNTLESLGLIKVVTTILEGPHRRNKTKYYGRVARNLFVGSQEESLSKYNRRVQEFSKLAGLLDIELPENYPDLASNLVKRDQKIYQESAKCLIKHEKLIYEENIDMSELFEFIKMILKIDPQYCEDLSDIVRIIQTEINKTS